MDKPVTAHLLKRYFKGNSTAEEEKLVEHWLKADPENPVLAQKWIEESAETDEALFAQVMGAKKQVWEKTTEQIQALEETDAEPNAITQQPGEKKLAGNTHTKKHHWKKAAVLSGLLLMAFSVYYYHYRPVSIVTSFGQVRTVTLPDSSVVYLNGNSKLTYTQPWQANKREIWLEGEAFFEVKHLANHQKFTVHLSNQTDIQVLGTAFNVSDRLSGKKIVLQSGKIKLNFDKGASDKDVYMVPGEMVILPAENASGKIRKTQVDPQFYSAWTHGKWMLQGTSLADMLEKLQETYGITTRVEDTLLLQRKASGSIPLPESNAAEASQLLHDMADLFDLTITEKEGIVYLRQRE